VLLLGFVHVIEVLVHVVIEFLLDLVSCLSHFFHDCVLHVAPESSRGHPRCGSTGFSVLRGLLRTPSPSP
jgi:hypothetical protein